MFSPAKVKSRRKSLKLTMAQAAQLASFLRPDGTPSKQRWYAIEKGNRPDPAFSTVESLARALGCRMDDFRA